MDYKRMWVANKEATRAIAQMKCGFFNFKLKKQIAHAKIELKHLEQEELLINAFDKCGISKLLEKQFSKKKKKKTIKKKKK